MEAVRARLLAFLGADPNAYDVSGGVTKGCQFGLGFVVVD